MTSDSVQNQSREDGLEAFGGGFEYFPFWQLPLWPFKWIRMFVREEE